jgi:hypothetical protein
LTWFKELDARLAKSRSAHSLISSNVCEPLEMLEKDIKANWDELRKLQSHNNDWGHPVLKERIARRYRIRPENILLTNGCTNANYLVIMSLVGPGDSVICEKPCYQPMWQAAQLIGAGIKWIARRPPDYRVDPDELSRLVDRGTSLVLLTNLHNPSGALLAEGDLESIARAVGRRNRRTRVLVDEVFRDLGPERPKPASAVDPLFISTGSLSKSYGLSHLECGWVMADIKTIERVTRLFVLSDGNGSRFLESLSAVVFSNLRSYADRSVAIVEGNRKTIRRIMEPLFDGRIIDGKIPEHGSIWFPSLRGVSDAGPFCEYAALRHRVYVVPGSFFGDRSRFRVGFGGDAGRFSSAIRRLSDAVVSYRRRR